MYKKIITNFLIIIMASTMAHAAQKVVTNTFYPSPFGSYEKLRLFPRAALPSPCLIGTLYMNSADSLIYYCRDDGTGIGTWEAMSGGIWSQNGNNIYTTDSTLRVGIGTTNPVFKLHLVTDGGIIAKGSIGVGTTIPNLGAGARFIWYPRKAAIRAGELDGAGDFWWDANIGIDSVAFGFDTLAVSNRSAVGGGSWNRINDSVDINSVIGGGFNNLIFTFWGNVPDNAAIGGGEGNIVCGSHAFLGGGKSNIAFGTNSTLIGGQSNQAWALYSTIGGGTSNIINLFSSYATIVGGNGNIINNASGGTSAGLASVILGGQNNKIKGQYATIGGGLNNNTSGDYQTVSGGESNGLDSIYNFRAMTVSGGFQNTTACDFCSVGGGFHNSAGQFNTNIAPATPTAGNTVIGGRNNGSLADRQYSFIGGGGGPTLAEGNIASGNFSTVVGGHRNTASGAYAFVGGGDSNTASGAYSVVPGGRSNTAAGAYSLAGGWNTNVTGSRTFAWGINNSGATNITQSDAFIIATGQVGIGVTAFVGTEKLRIGGSFKTTQLSLTTSSVASLPNSGLRLRNQASGLIGYDLAELFDSSEEVEIGDVLTLDEHQKNKLKKSYTPYDQKVVGVVSGAPAISFEGSQTQLNPEAFNFTKGTKPPVALSGRVPCKVSLENGSIEPGDLLTSSSTPGHAMKASDWEKSFGTIIGKALEPFTGNTHGEKTGIIKIMVSRR